VQAAARADPRLAEAAGHTADGRITQFLAGVPALLERYRNAPAAAKALIEAAMDARRLGHGLYLPHDLLEAAAPGYLTDEQWDALREDWLEQALAYCAAPCRGARGPLTRIRARPGQGPLTQPHYRLADYLEQTGRTMRRSVLAPANLWDALLEHANERDLLRIADEAKQRGLYRYAFRLYERAADVGDHDVLVRAAELLEETGGTDEAINWLQTRAAETGNHHALAVAALLLEQVGRTDEAINLYQQAAATGNHDALVQAARLLERAGRTDEAISLYQQAADTGDHKVLVRVAELLEQVGRTDEAISLYQQAAETGYSLALSLAAELLKRVGRMEEAAQLRLYGLEPVGHIASEWHYLE
jgi:tetratricopeptide (TPR) repeat protein